MTEEKKGYTITPEQRDTVMEFLREIQWKIRCSRLMRRCEEAERIMNGLPELK